MLKNITMALITPNRPMVAWNLVKMFSTVSQRKTTVMETIKLQEVNDCGIIILNRPQQLNTITIPFATEIQFTIKNWKHTKKLVIIRGTNNKVFCAGGDLKDILSGIKKLKCGQKFHETDTGLALRKTYSAHHLVSTYKIPYIAIMDGMTIGGGSGFCVHSKYRIATENTIYAIPENCIGLFPDAGNTYFLPRLKGKLGFFLGLSGYRLKGVDVLSAGIATHYVPSTNLEDVVSELLKNDSSVDAVLQPYAPDNVEQNFILAPNIDMINKCFSAPTVEEIMKRLTENETDFSKNILHLLSKMSPTSLKVTKRAFEQGATLTLDECLQMEYRLFCRCAVDNSDFSEGIRAMFLDRDQNPKWNAKSLEEVSDDYVNKKFEPVAAGFELNFSKL